MYCRHLSHSFHKYCSVIRLGIENTLVYRVNFLIRSGFNLIPLFTGLAVWRTIYAGGKDNVAGYTMAAMLSYYLVAAVVDALTAPTEDDWQIAGEIKDGHISQFIVKPLDYLAYRGCMFFSGRLIYSLAAVIPVTLFLVVNRHWLIPSPDPVTLAVFGFSVLCSALNQFLLAFLTALLAFWVLEISSFTFVLLAFERLAGGMMFPLDILPRSLETVLLFTPFPAQIFVPVEIYLGRLHGPELWLHLGLQVFWVLALYACARLVWNRGVRSYAAVGG